MTEFRSLFQFWNQHKERFIHSFCDFSYPETFLHYFDNLESHSFPIVMEKKSPGPEALRG